MCLGGLGGTLLVILLIVSIEKYQATSAPSGEPGHRPAVEAITAFQEYIEP